MLSTYLNEIRISYVRNMFLHTDMPMIEIRMECGFEDFERVGTGSKIGNKSGVSIRIRDLCTGNGI